MRVVARGALACLLALGLSAPVGAMETQGKAERISMTTGEWRVSPEADRGYVKLELRREWRSSKGNGRSIHSFDIRREELAGLSPGDWTGSGEVDFIVTRDAGRMRFEGTMRRGRGSGTYAFEPNSAFRAQLARDGFRDVTDDDLMRLALHDIGREWIRGFDHGDRLALDDIIRFKLHDVSPEYVNALLVSGYRGIGPDEIVRFKVHGIDADYVRALAVLGSDGPSPDELVRLKVHGVTPDYVRDMRALASPPPGVEDIVRMHVHGVQPEFVRGMMSAGYGRLGPEALVRLKVSGVTASDARRARTRFGELSVEELIRLKHRGQI
jgi:hypothetical protein